MPKAAIHALLITSFYIASFLSAASALKCYEEHASLTEEKQPATEKECTGGEQGCGTARECYLNGTYTGLAYTMNTDMRACTSESNFCNEVVEFQGIKGPTIKWNELCKECSYCTGDLCNDQGIQKTALFCYSELSVARENNPGPGLCLGGEQGCFTARECNINGTNTGVVRSCTSDPDFCNKVVQHEGFGPTTITWNQLCKECNYCTGDLCNDQGIEKSGLQCILKIEQNERAIAEECQTHHVGCSSVWDCTAIRRTSFDSQGSCVQYKDYCSNRELTRWEGLAYGDVCRCRFCEEDMCNVMAARRKPNRKIPKMPETTKMPGTEEENSVEVEPPPQTEENKPNGEDGTVPENGVGGIVGWGQIGIIPIGMMTLLLGGGLLKILAI